jgi:hypothetical protein
MALDSLSSTFTGRVASVNTKGIRLDGHESWFNISRFAPDVVLPERGETVTVVVDAKGFLRSVRGADGVPLPVSGGSAAPSAPAATTKDRTISRLALIKAAAEFAAARPQLKSGDVLRIAESWEKWVLRDDSPADDLVDAF